MARPKQTVCTNCNGENDKCKYLTTGRKCRKGQAVGKAKGKAISSKTKEKNEKYLELLDELHYDYTHEQDSKVFEEMQTALIKNKSLFSVSYKPLDYVKYVSFYRWLKNKELHTLASWYQRNIANKGNADKYDYDYPFYEINESL